MIKQRLLSLMVLLAACMAGGWYVLGHFEEFASLRINRPSLMAPLTCLIFLMLLVNGYVSALWYRIFGLRLNSSEWLGLSALNTFGNFVTPFRGGSVSNAVYLKQRYGFSYATFAGILAAVSVITFWVNSVVGLLSLALIYWCYGYFSLLAALLFGSAFLFLAAVIWFAPIVGEPASPWLQRYAKAINGWHKIRSKRLGLAQTIGLQIVNILALTLITQLEFAVLGITLELPKALFLGMFPAFSLIVSITPGNLGIREALSIFSGLVIDVPVPEVLAVSILDRFATFSLSFILGAVYYPILARRTPT